MLHAVQEPLIAAEADPVPDLRGIDLILLPSSGGKDSEAMLDYVAELADTADAMDRVVVLHNDLGEVEWPGTEELARQQAELYGWRFEMRHRTQGLLLQQIQQRSDTLRAKGDTTTPAWPSSASRYCTSDQKRGPGRKLITELVTELGLNRQARVLYGMGIRAAESSGRAKKPCMVVDPAATSGNREVTTWLPIRTWSDHGVWSRIADRGLPYHWAYDAGMDRLSCSFCVLGSWDDCVNAARLRPELVAKYVALEASVGHRFRMDFSIADVAAEAARLGPIRFERGDALRRHLGIAVATAYLAA